MYTPAELQKASGVSLHTLRTWERRYGILAPVRTPGGHRRYTETDLTLLRWLRQCTDKGLSVRQALDTFALHVPQGSSLAPPVLALDAAEALLRQREDLAAGILSRALAAYPLETLSLEIAGRAADHLGEALEQGRTSLSGLRLAATFLSRYLERLMGTTTLLQGPPSTIVTTVPGDAHGIGSVIGTLLLRRAGIPTGYFGTSPTLEELADCLSHQQPDVLVLSASLTPALEAFQQAWPTLGSMARHRIVLVGRVTVEDAASANHGLPQLGADWHHILDWIRQRVTTSDRA
jgi:DNA-binding transcriptional MerR regulator/methylmalonyl-CoA mutase cobalamin-binding subunit